MAYKNYNNTNGGSANYVGKLGGTTSNAPTLTVPLNTSTKKTTAPLIPESKITVPTNPTYTEIPVAKAYTPATTTQSSTVSDLVYDIPVSDAQLKNALETQVKPAATETETETPATTREVTPAANGSNNGVSLYQSYLDSILAQQKAAADARQKALEENYQRQLGVLQNAHNSNIANLDTQKEDALRSAYISYMLGQRGLNQQLANQGITGGATESILANLANNYGGNRNSIANQYQQALSSLNSAYDSNLANLANTYASNSADVMADYNNQAATARQNYANQMIDYQQALAKASASASNSGTTSSTTKATTDRRKTVSAGIAANKENPTTLLKYLDSLTDYSDAEKDELLLESGIDPESLFAALMG